VIRFSFFLLLFLIYVPIAAQDHRTQYPFFLSDHTYFEANVSYINYHFTNLQMEPPFHAESVRIPHIGVRLILFGYQFNKYISAQISYTRPVFWVKYVNINGDHFAHSMPTNVAGLTMKSQLPLSEKFTIYGEAGLGIITRTGIVYNDSIIVVKNANYSSFLLGAGLQYRYNQKITYQAGLGWSPSKTKFNQPATTFFYGGLIYRVHKLSEKRVEDNQNSEFIFPENLLQVGFTTNLFGYGANNFFSNKILPIFWGGDVKVRQEVSMTFERNIFHGRKLFSLDWGTNFSYWESKIGRNKFYTISLFPVFRFTAFHFARTDLYFDYSVAGPTYISKVTIDHTKIGKKFTFQDFMGTGVNAGKKRQVNAEIRILHYSNGDLFPDNSGVKVPLSFYVGYAF